MTTDALPLPSDDARSGPVLDRRAFVVGGVFAAAAGAAVLRLPQPVAPPIPKDKFANLLPNRVGEWTFQQSSGLVLPPEDALSDRLYDNLGTRVYTNPAGQVMMFLVAYKNFQNGVLQIHRPEICYPAGGYALSPTLPTTLQIGPNESIPASAFSATSNARSEQVLYWTRIGDRFPVSWAEQRLAVLRSNLKQINPDGMLARVSMANDDMAASRPQMIAFISQLRAVSPPLLRRVLFGPLA
ncbi:exosortase-associated protein EpsI, V-type [Sphingomonas sp. RS2018]